MDPAERFFRGFCGSAAVELITLLQIYHGPTIRMPERYKRKGFWVVRLLLSVMAGGLAVGYKLDNPIVALNVGAATPSILIAFTRGYKENESTPQTTGGASAPAPRV
jgi:hypothetical protein